MQENTICETESLRLLAGFDFLDVCLLGETGTGKSHAARLIHEFSPRSRKPFVAVNCAELAPSIIESELFGYERGAFTGATSSRTGRFETAQGGTLFLDEIGDLAPEIQAKLLKAVEEKCVTRVGGVRPRFVDARIIYATHRDLSVLREDLRYRIAAHTVHLKPLRERRHEILPLAKLFLSEFARKSGRAVAAQDDALALLENHNWLGNVRELRSFVQRTCVDALFLNAGNEVCANRNIELTKEFLMPRLEALAFDQTRRAAKSNALAELISHFQPGEKMEECIREIETRLLEKAMRANNNNQTHAAKDLGLSRGGLIKKLKRISH